MCQSLQLLHAFHRQAPLRSAQVFNCFVTVTVREWLVSNVVDTQARSSAPASARSAKALSKYTDMVDSMARQQRELLEGASDNARVKLREWELPEALNVRGNSLARLLPSLKHAGFCQLPTDTAGSLMKEHKSTLYTYHARGTLGGFGMHWIGSCAVSHCY